MGRLGRAGRERGRNDHVEDGGWVTGGGGGGDCFLKAIFVNLILRH